MSNVELTTENEGVSVEVTFERIADGLGEQHILDTDTENPEFAYLAALALETKEDSRYTIEETLMEFIRNTSALDNLDRDDFDKIETILNK